MLQKYWQGLIQKIMHSFKEQRGQSLVILAGAIVGIIGMLGLALDLGLVYIERVRLNRATDAAVLAAVVDLSSSEEEAIIRAVEYLKLNGYDVGQDVRVKVRGCMPSLGGGNVNEDWTPADNSSGTVMPYTPKPRIVGYQANQDGFLWDVPGVPDDELRAVFMIDTGSYREEQNDFGDHDCGVETDSGSTVYKLGSATRIKVAGRAYVPMNFMRLPTLGAFNSVPVYAEGIAENLDSLDIMMVFDLSGSMEFETACFDCWVKDREWDNTLDIENYPYPTGNGYYNPVPFDTLATEVSVGSSIITSAICIPITTTFVGGVPINEEVNYVLPSYSETDPNPSDPLNPQAFYYSVHEAELYSSVGLRGNENANNPWNLESRFPGQGFWALQRGSRNEEGHQTRSFADKNYARADGTLYTAFDFSAYVGPDVSGPNGEHYDFFQGNQAGNWKKQSANVCNPGIAGTAASGTYIDCALGNPGGNNPDNTICATPLVAPNGNLFGPIDCSAYIQAQPYLTYPPNQGDNALGGTYDQNCFTGDCWGDANFLAQPAYVEYDFTNRGGWGDQTHIWIRAIGSGQGATEWEGTTAPEELPDRTGWRNRLFWEVYSPIDYPPGTEPPGPVNELEEWDELILAGTYSEWRDNFNNLKGFEDYWRDTRALNEEWKWIYLGTADATQPQKRYTLRIYQGSSGLKIDRILFTNNPGQKSDGDTSRYEQLLKVFSFNSEDINGNPLLAFPYSNTSSTDEGRRHGVGPSISPGSGTREACNPLNPIYGLQVSSSDARCDYFPADRDGGGGSTCTDFGEVPAPSDDLGNRDQRNNDLYHDHEPLRSAKEAAKQFILSSQLDPAKDQIGFVGFANDVINDGKARSKLQCRQATEGSCRNDNNDVAYAKVLQAIENQWPLNGTDIAEGLREGLEELGVPENAKDWNNGISGNRTGCSDTSNDGESCVRRTTSQKIMILLTDGVPSEAPGSPYLDNNGNLQHSRSWGSEPDSDACTNGNNSESYVYWDGGAKGNAEDPYYQCAMYYAFLAADNNVTLYTIGLGGQIDPDLLQAMAEGYYIRENGAKSEFFNASGKGFFASNPSSLEGIFDQILDSIFVRIVG